MNYKILSTKEFSKDFMKVGSSMQKRIKKKFEEIKEDPTRFKMLHYDLSGSCRVWIGKLRIIFSYDVSKKEVYLEKIVFKHRY